MDPWSYTVGRYSVLGTGEKGRVSLCTIALGRDLGRGLKRALDQAPRRALHGSVVQEVYTNNRRLSATRLDYDTIYYAPRYCRTYRITRCVGWIARSRTVGFFCFFSFRSLPTQRFIISVLPTTLHQTTYHRLQHFQPKLCLFSASFPFAPHHPHL